jgi:hypothetical protein
MNENYRQIYSELYYDAFPEIFHRTLLKLFGGQPFGPWSEEAGWLRRIIDDVEKELLRSSTYELRADAKFWLLTNLWYMIVVPTQRAGKEPGEVKNIIASDVRTIVSHAVEMAKKTNKRELSAHSIVEALHGSWNHLKSGALDLWE